MSTVFRILVMLVMTAAFTPNANAKSLGTCEAVYAHYKKDKSPHKAFATTNGTRPGQGDMACGASGGNDMGRVSYEALRQCKSAARENHFSGKCRIIRRQ
jgi:hypothetical protein